MKKLLIILTIAILGISCRKEQNIHISKEVNKVTTEYVSTHQFKLEAIVAYNNNETRYWELSSNGNYIEIADLPLDLFWKYKVGDIIPSYILLQYYEEFN